jgi:carbamoyltransferase
LIKPIADLQNDVAADERSVRSPELIIFNGLQAVHKETNPRYYRLIEHFREVTGIPMVLNTSFNENEPVVCYPEEALDCFLRTRMDLLVLGNCFIERA